MINLTQKRLKEVLYYNSETGIFKWIKSRSGVKIGIAGCINQGYIKITIDGVKYTAHRLAFLYMEGYWPENDIDHKNQIKADNSWSNLREVSQSCNSRNCKLSKKNKSGVTGVNKKNNKWIAYIGVNSKLTYLGIFVNFIDAVRARYKAEIKYNYPNCQTTSTAYLYLK